MQNSAEFSWDSHSDDITDCEAQAAPGGSFLLTCIKTHPLTHMLFLHTHAHWDMDGEMIKPFFLSSY